MTALKERDKKLLVFLAILIILVVSVLYVILPTVDNNASLEDAIIVAESSCDEMELKLAQYQMDQATHAALQTTYAETTKDFYSRMENQEIDRLITGIILKKNLITRDLTIAGGEVPAAVEPFYTSGLEISANPGLLIANVAAKCEGTRATLLSLIDLFTNQYPSIRVTEYQLTAGESVKTADGVPAETPYTLSLGLDIYMCDKVG